MKILILKEALRKILLFLHKNKFSLIYIFLLLFLAVLYFVNFYDLPMSEDAGLYAYLSRAVENGIRLHSDIPFTSSSIGIYSAAAVFKIFGPSLFVYRIFHFFGLLFVIFTIYTLIKKNLGEFYGFLASLLSGVFILLPHITLDLGRHYLFFAVGFVLLAFIINYSNIKNRNFWMAICLGLAALTRETFVIVGIAYPMLIIIKNIFRRTGVKKTVLIILPYVIGYVLVLSIDAIILTLTQSWTSYIKDMFQSGASFRYSYGFLSIQRLKENLHALQYGFYNFYYPIVFASFFAYLIPTKNKIINIIKYFLIPVFIFEVLFINKTGEYTVIPLLILFSMLSSFLIYKIKQTKFTYALIVILFIISLGPIKNIKNQFLGYRNLNSYLNNDYLKTSDLHTERLLYVVDKLQYKTISTYSQFPFLFLLKGFRYMPLSLEDLSAAANLGRPELWSAQMRYLTNKPVDLVVLKTTNDYLSRYTDLGKILDSNYLIVADFDFSPYSSTAYRDRIYISKKNLNQYYLQGKVRKIFFLQKKEFTYKGNNYTKKGEIIEIETNPQASVKNLSISSNKSTISYNDKYSSSNKIFSFVPPNTNFTINSIDRIDDLEFYMTIKYYYQK